MTDRVEINPNVMLGKPVIRGTRILLTEDKDSGWLCLPATRTRLGSSCSVSQETLDRLWLKLRQNWRTSKAHRSMALSS